MPEPWLAAVTYADARSGRHDSARTSLEQLTAGGVTMDVNWLQACLLADAAADLGPRGMPRRYLHGRLSTARRPLRGDRPRRGLLLLNEELYLGRLAATLGRLDEAEARLRRAVARQRGGRDPHVRRDRRGLRLGAVHSPSAATAPQRARCSAATVARAEQLAMPALAADGGPRRRQ